MGVPWRSRRSTRSTPGSTPWRRPPAELRENKRYGRGDFSHPGRGGAVREDFGDQGSTSGVVHSLANDPEVKNSLLDTDLTAISKP